MNQNSHPHPGSTREMIEVVDHANRPLLVLPREEAHRQHLLHRSVLVSLFDSCSRLFLQKRSRNKATYPGRWDISVSGHVLAGESTKEAALREMQEELGIRPPRVALRQEIPASEATGFEFVSLFQATCEPEQIQINPDEVDDGHFMDQEELAYMIQEYPDLVTPALTYFVSLNILFPIRLTG